MGSVLGRSFAPGKCLRWFAACGAEPVSTIDIVFPSVMPSGGGGGSSLPAATAATTRFCASVRLCLKDGVVDVDVVSVVELASVALGASPSALDVEVAFEFCCARCRLCSFFW